MHSLYKTKHSQIESEYQLVDPERLKNDLRTSRTTPDSPLNYKHTYKFTSPR